MKNKIQGGSPILPCQGNNDTKNPNRPASPEINKQIPNTEGADTVGSPDTHLGDRTAATTNRKRKRPLGKLITAQIETQKTSPKTKSEELFGLIPQPTESNVAVQQVGEIKVHTLTASGSTLHAHPMPTAADTYSYWQHIFTNKIPMIVQLETAGVNYIPNPQGVKDPNPTAISLKPFKAQELDISIGGGVNITEGASRYPVTVKNLSSANDTSILRVLWPDHGPISAKMLQEIVPRIPNNAAVHCKQGKGRTGVIAIGHQMNAAFKTGALTKYNVVSSIFDAIKYARQQRQSDSLVENNAQFESLIKYGQSLTGATDKMISIQIEGLLLMDNVTYDPNKDDQNLNDTMNS